MHPHWHKYFWVMHDWCFVTYSLIKSYQAFTFRLHWPSAPFPPRGETFHSSARSSTSCKSPHSASPPCLTAVEIAVTQCPFPTQCPFHLICRRGNHKYHRILEDVRTRTFQIKSHDDGHRKWPVPCEPRSRAYSRNLLGSQDQILLSPALLWPAG